MLHLFWLLNFYYMWLEAMGLPGNSVHYTTWMSGYALILHGSPMTSVLGFSKHWVYHRKDVIYIAIDLEMIGTYQRIIFSVWRLPMDCGHRRTNKVQLDINNTSCSERVVKLGAYCTLSSRNESQHRSSIPWSVVYVLVPLDTYC